MGKFKKWLIHKLGGMCPDDMIQPLYQVESRKVKSLYLEFKIDDLKYAIMRKDMTDEEIYEEMQKFFVHNWGETVIDYATITREQKDGYVEWTSTLEVVEKGDVKRVEEDNR